MAADEVDALATPAVYGAFTDREFIQPGALDAVMIAFGSDVADLDAFNRDAGDGIRQIAAVIKVESVA